MSEAELALFGAARDAALAAVATTTTRSTDVIVPGAATRTQLREFSMISDDLAPNAEITETFQRASRIDQFRWLAERRGMSNQAIEDIVRFLETTSMSDTDLMGFLTSGPQILGDIKQGDWGTSTGPAPAHIARVPILDVTRLVRNLNSRSADLISHHNFVAYASAYEVIKKEWKDEQIHFTCSGCTCYFDTETEEVMGDAAGVLDAAHRIQPIGPVKLWIPDVSAGQLRALDAFLTLYVVTFKAGKVVVEERAAVDKALIMIPGFQRMKSAIVGLVRPFIEAVRKLKVNPQDAKNDHLAFLAHNLSASGVLNASFKKNKDIEKAYTPYMEQLAEIANLDLGKVAVMVTTKQTPKMPGISSAISMEAALKLLSASRTYRRGHPDKKARDAFLPKGIAQLGNAGSVNLKWKEAISDFSALSGVLATRGHAGKFYVLGAGDNCWFGNQIKVVAGEPDAWFDLKPCRRQGITTVQGDVMEMYRRGSEFFRGSRIISDLCERNKMSKTLGEETAAKNSQDDYEQQKPIMEWLREAGADLVAAKGFLPASCALFLEDMNAWREAGYSIALISGGRMHNAEFLLIACRRPPGEPPSKLEVFRPYCASFHYRSAWTIYLANQIRNTFVDCGIVDHGFDRLFKCDGEFVINVMRWIEQPSIRTLQSQDEGAMMSEFMGSLSLSESIASIQNDDDE